MARRGGGGGGGAGEGRKGKRARSPELQSGARGCCPPTVIRRMNYDWMDSASRGTGVDVISLSGRLHASVDT